MKNFIKGVIGAIIGLLVGAILCWGGLYLYGVYVLRGEGSLFDTNPDAANAFFTAWFLLSVVCAVVGAKLAIHRRPERGDARW